MNRVTVPVAARAADGERTPHSEQNGKRKETKKKNTQTEDYTYNYKIYIQRRRCVGEAWRVNSQRNNGRGAAIGAGDHRVVITMGSI